MAVRVASRRDGGSDGGSGKGIPGRVAASGKTLSPEEGAADERLARTKPVEHGSAPTGEPTSVDALGSPTHRLTLGPATGSNPAQPSAGDDGDAEPGSKRRPLFGFMAVPVSRRFPIRRSTLLMAVAFIGFGTLLYINPPQSTSIGGGALINGAGRSVVLRAGRR